MSRTETPYFELAKKTGEVDGETREHFVIATRNDKPAYTSAARNIAEMLRQAKAAGELDTAVDQFIAAVESIPSRGRRGSFTLERG